MTRTTKQTNSHMVAPFYPFRFYGSGYNGQTMMTSFTVRIRNTRFSLRTELVLHFSSSLYFGVRQFTSDDFFMLSWTRVMLLCVFPKVLSSFFECMTTALSGNSSMINLWLNASFAWYAIYTGGFGLFASQLCK